MNNQTEKPQSELATALNDYASIASAQVQSQFDHAIRDAFLAGVKFGLHWGSPEERPQS